MGFTDKQRRFVEEYLVDLNATQAAIRAGYSEKTAGNIGFENLQKPEISKEIQAAIAERSERTQVTQDRVISELARIGFSDMRDFARWGEGGVRLLESEDLAEDHARCVAEVSQSISDSGGSLRFKLHDKVGALRDLGKHLGMFTEKHEHSGDIRIQVVYDDE